MTKTLNLENRTEIHDRGSLGFAVYAKGMNRSVSEKAKILPYVKAGNIVEMGCGNGVVLELLSTVYPTSNIVGVDISDTMLDMTYERTKNRNVRLIQEDITKIEFEENSLDTIVFCSILHEIYSYNGYDRNAIHDVLTKAFEALRPGGRLIIRDGVKPKSDLVHLDFKNDETKEKFYRFVIDFGPYKIPFSEEDGKVKLRRNDAMEFLSKYIYDVNWNIEVKEQFGIYTLDQYKTKVEEIGFDIIHAESYLIEWLRKTHYEKDLEVLKKVDNQFVKENYPDSTMILIAEKPIKSKGFYSEILLQSGESK